MIAAIPKNFFIFLLPKNKFFPAFPQPVAFILEFRPQQISAKKGPKQRQISTNFQKNSDKSAQSPKTPKIDANLN
ncbi:MAG: hypothetical protein IJR40_04770 [Treponema sp.]|nr:hypothetical protein [Treponema sp.]